MSNFNRPPHPAFGHLLPRGEGTFHAFGLQHTHLATVALQTRVPLNREIQYRIEPVSWTDEAGRLDFEDSRLDGPGSLDDSHLLGGPHAVGPFGNRAGR